MATHAPSMPLTYARPATAAAVPWYLWSGVVAVTSVAIGAHWDVSWHRSIGRDSFLTPAHIAIYLCGILAAISCGYLVLNTTFNPKSALRGSSVTVFGLRAPLGAFIASWGGIAMLTSAPFDNWWHNAYGLDVKIVSPPHVVLMLGIFAVALGSLILLLSAMNRAKASGADPATTHTLQLMFLYVGGLLLVLQMFFRMEYTWDVELHNARAYISMAVALPTFFAMMSQASRNRWATTIVSAIYTVFLVGAVLILPLFHAEPKLGPVFVAVTHFVPPGFPVLLLVPAVLLDLFWSRTRTWKPWQIALVSGPLFILPLLAVQWPFADFLMSPWSANRLFATNAFGYYTRPRFAHDPPPVLRAAVRPRPLVRHRVGDGLRHPLHLGRPRLRQVDARRPALNLGSDCSAW